MAVATYGTDLATVNLADAVTNWVEMTNRTSGGAVALEDRAHLQGTNAISQSTGVATGRTMGLQVDYLSNISWTSGFVFLMWQYFQAPKAIGIWADGGMRIGVGSTAGNMKLWNALGNDYGRNPYGGWTNTAIDPTYTADEILLSPVDGAYRIFCSAPYMLLAVAKGNPHCVDAIRYGRGQVKIEFGDATAYGTFPAMASANDADAARWGLFQATPGGYLWKGLISLGTATNAVDFRDANRNIAIDNTPRTYATFNLIEIRNATSRVDWTSISIANVMAVASPLSRGSLEVVDDCDVNFSNCSFTDMNIFIFKAASDVLNCVFRRCNTITANDAKFAGTFFDLASVAANTSQLVWNVNTDPATDLANCSFTKGTNAHHAIEFGTTSPLTLTLNKLSFSGFNASNNLDDSALHILRTTGTVTVYANGCTGIISYKSAGATVSVQVDSVTFTVTAKTLAGANIQYANVLVLAKDATGPMPYDVTVTIVNSGTTATVTHTSHGMATNDKVQIKGASLWQNNGVFSITYSDVNTYTYTLPEDPSSSPGGTIKATHAALSGLTDVNGVITNSRVFTSSQPITGRVRKSSAVPYYKTASIVGEISNTTGFSTTVQMISDE